MDAITILHLEDSAIDAELIRARLAMLLPGVEIDWASDKQTFEQALALRKYDLILADHTLPDYDGGTALDTVRAVDRDVAFIFVSGTLGEELAVDMIKRGATDYVLKQRLDRLGSAIREALLLAREKRERRSAERRLRESEERYGLLFEHAPEGILILREDGGIVEVNEQLCALLGYERGDLLRLHIGAIVTPADHEHIRRARRARLDAGEVYMSEWSLRDSDGLPIAVEVHAGSMPDGRWQAFVRDIRDRKLAEHTLRETEERLRLMIESVTDFAIFTIDVDGNVTSWNQGAARVFGFQEHEIIGHDAARLFTADDQRGDVPANEIAIAAAEGKSEDERWHQRRDGSRFFASGVLTATRDPDGHLRGFTKVLRDITQRKQWEQSLSDWLERLQESADRLQHVAEASLTVNASLTIDSVLRIVTEEARRIIPCEQAIAIITLPGGDSAYQHANSQAGSLHTPEHDGRLLPNTPPARVCATNRAARLYDAELAIEYPWNERILQHSTAAHPSWLGAPLIAQDGMNLGIVQLINKLDDGFDSDDEAILQQLANVASIAIQNCRLYEALREADRRKDEFLAMLAHELRNPLAPIRNALHILDLQVTDRPDVRLATDMMTRQVEHMVQLVDDLLDVSRITRGKISLRLEPLDIVEIVRRAIESSHTFIDRRNHQLQVHLPERSIYVLGDATRLAQSIANLLVNAAKFTPERGTIECHVELADSRVQIRVRDSGIGLTRESLTQIFDLFFQSDRTLDRAQGGLGIGLTLVKRLIDMQGGTVSASSPGLGNGSEFCISLPMIPETSAANADGRVTPALSNRSFRVLVVDDHQDAANSLTMMLQLWGHDVRTIYEGREIIEIALEYRPEIILLDIGLPGLSGFEIARALRSDGAFAQTPIVALTGYGSEEDRRRSADNGFDHHLVKPVQPAALRELLVTLAVRAPRRES